MKTTEIEMSDEFDISLEKIEFGGQARVPEDDESGEEYADRSYFHYRLNFGDDGYTELPVTLVCNYTDLAELKQKADLQLYVKLAHFAELARRAADAPDVTFKSPED